MAADVFPQIGHLPIKQVTSAHLLKIIKTAESRGAESVAMLIRQWCSAIFRYAVANLQADSVFDLRGILTRVLHAGLTRPNVLQYGSGCG